MLSNLSESPVLCVLGAGPAGLMAAEILANHGYAVQVFEAMPSVGRKFLMAGKGGMNITHSEPQEAFVARYADRAASLAPLLTDFGPDALRDWIHGLGVETFVGSSGRVFPREMKAAPLLRAWLHRLREAGVVFHVRHRWQGWTEQGLLRFASPAGEVLVQPSGTILALGGASWPQLGSDGAWLPWLAERSIDIAPLKPANCGFDTGWSDYFRERFAGEPLKNVVGRCQALDGQSREKAGECLISASGIEGGLVYALSAPLRDRLLAEGEAVLELDLLPDFSADKVRAEVVHPRGSRSLSSHLQSRLGLKGSKLALLYECLGKDGMQDAVRLAAAIKGLPLKLQATRPIAEAISTAGGIRFEALDAGLMLKRLPGVFAAGEMLDWEAPTGGYLLTACFATGRAAGLGMAKWLSSQA